ncbi:MAG: MMPL family transporter, partial [Bacteroidales bacterium]|nr:MMPL family transporter [Bacteroidales bacterium]
MKNINSGIVDYILKHGKIISVAILLLTLFFGYQLRNLTVYGGFDVWYKSTDPILNVYEEYVKTFGNDENFVLIYSSDSLFTEFHFNYNRELTRRLTELEGVSEVISLSTIKIPAFNGIQMRLKPLIPEHSANPEDLFQQVSGMPLLVNNLISKDGRSTGIAIFPEVDIPNKKLLSQVETIAKDIRSKGYPAHIFGPLSIKEEVHQLANREAGKFLLIAIVIMIGLLYIILKKFLLAILPVLLALMTVVWTLGIFVLTGKTMNV